MQTIRIGLVGTGFMGKAHALAYKAAGTVFDLPATIVCEMIAGSSAVGAAEKATLFGFRRSTGNWRALIEDPNVDAVNISTPPSLHLEMVMAAVAARKPVFCEKPLAMNSQEALAMAEAAEAAGVPNLVGYNYIKHPTNRLAHQMITSGEIGDVVQVHAKHVEDYMRDPTRPAGWRVFAKTASAAGALSDVGSHIINAMLRLIGPIESVVSDVGIVYKTRRAAEGVGSIVVENDDHGHFLARFTNGAIGSIAFSRIAAGKKNGYAYEVIGTRGTIAFDQERPGEIHLFRIGHDVGREGFTRILIGPEHPDYGDFCVAGGHGIGYNDQIIIEARDFVRAFVGGEPVWPTFRDGYEVDRVIDAILLSKARKAWVDIAEFPNASLGRAAQ